MNVLDSKKKTVLWCDPIIIPATCLKFDHVCICSAFPDTHDTFDAIRKIRYTSVMCAIIIVSIVLRDDLSFPWIWLSPRYLRKSLICNNTRNKGARAISEIIGAMARKKVRREIYGDVLWELQRGYEWIIVITILIINDSN